MDFELTADQVDLQEGIRKQLGGRFPMSTVRGLEAAPGAVDIALWAELAEAGVFALRLPEADEGVGLGWAEAALVFEELGRALVPGPAVATHLAAGLVEGDVVGLVDLDAAGPLLVENLDALDALVVLSASGLGLADLDVVRAGAVPLPRPLDPLTPLHRVGAVPVAEPLGDAERARAWRLGGAVLTGALQVGIASSCTDRAVAYAHQRHQFERPIGSFQAVKHLCADMLTRAEVARSAVYAAAVMLDDPVVGDPSRGAAVAKLTAGEAALLNGKACIQIHGGMGFTWEIDAHLYLKRAWVLETHFGSSDHHADALAKAL